ncbi:MAG: tetratricopeptide repeat protein [Lachnospiraceae bacterium]|nr:tetratricopeptide repeat protein [Lachnospiraceae bacterium]
MKCYVCGNRLSEHDFCTACGADVGAYKKIMKTSNALYNDGLEKAKVRDLSGAVSSLRLSLKYNKRNIQARNLLGLIYFEMGEAVSAMSEWVISKNLEGTKNIADDFITALQSNPTQLDTINQTIRKYNQALNYCHMDSQDLAIIQLKKVLSINQNLIVGHQLLALLYIAGEEYEKARQTLMRAIRIDANNTTTLSYLKEVDRVLREREEKETGKKKKSQGEVYSYTSGNETIIQPGYAKEKIGFSSIINIVIGIVVGLAICWFLVLPARIEKATAENDAKFISVSEQLTAEQADKEMVKEQLSESQQEVRDLQQQIDEMTGNAGTITINDYLNQACTIYLEDPDNAEGIMEALGNISPEALSEVSSTFSNLYSKLYSAAGLHAVKQYMDKGRAAMRSSEYQVAIEQFEKAWALDSSDSDILMNLAHAYRQSGDTQKADELYIQLMRDFPDTQNAIDAEGYITTPVG